MDYFAAAAGLPMPARYGYHSTSTPDCGVPFMISEIGGIGWATEGRLGLRRGPEEPRRVLRPLPGHARRAAGQPEPVRLLLHAVDRRRAGAQRAVLLQPPAEVRREADLRHHVPPGGLRARRADRPAAGGPCRSAQWKVLVGAQQDGKLCTPWRYVTKTPQGDWTAAGFDDTAWPSGLAPFGRDPDWPTKTPWTTSDIYLRKTFEYDGAELKAGAVVISYDEDTEVYVNGQKILSVQNYIGHYEMHVVTAGAAQGVAKRHEHRGRPHAPDRRRPAHRSCAAVPVARREMQFRGSSRICSRNTQNAPGLQSGGRWSRCYT